MMFLGGTAVAAPPWDGPSPVIPGEEDPLRLARALDAWWATDGGPAAVVGVSPSRSPVRWAAAPPIGRRATLLLPESAFPPSTGSLRERLGRSWTGEEVVEEPPDSLEAGILVVVGAEPPGRFAERLRELARSPALAGKFLAAWSLAGPLRDDLATAILADGGPAAVGFAGDSLQDRRRAERHLGTLGEAIARPTDGSTRPEHLPGPFLWFY
jgi:hypothetical protein